MGQDRRAQQINRRSASARHVKLPHVGKGDVLATLVSAPPGGEGWVHEIKFDGYRLLAVMADRHAELFTRAANDWSERFKPLCAAFAKLKVSSAVIDGEVVHLADDGMMARSQLVITLLEKVRLKRSIWRHQTTSSPVTECVSGSNRRHRMHLLRAGNPKHYDRIRLRPATSVICLFRRRRNPRDTTLLIPNPNRMHWRGSQRMPEFFGRWLPPLRSESR